MCPNRGWDPQPFGVQDVPTNWATQPECQLIHFKELLSFWQCLWLSIKVASGPEVVNSPQMMMWHLRVIWGFQSRFFIALLKRSLMKDLLWTRTKCLQEEGKLTHSIDVSILQGYVEGNTVRRPGFWQSLLNRFLDHRGVKANKSLVCLKDT